MPYYIRLLKHPVLVFGQGISSSRGSRKNATGLTTAATGSRGKHVVGSKGGSGDRDARRSGVEAGMQMQVKISVTTDLGDRFYGGDLGIAVCLMKEDDLVGRGCVRWRGGMRVLNAGVGLTGLGAGGEARVDGDGDVEKGEGEEGEEEDRYWVWFEVEADGDGEHGGGDRAGMGSRLGGGLMPEIVGLMARVVIGDAVREMASGFSGRRHERGRERRLLRQHVERKFEMCGAKSAAVDEREILHLWIYEEMGESIARHVWDAALALLAVCANSFSLNQPTQGSFGETAPLFNLLKPVLSPSVKRSRRIQILELGSGCGMVGLGLARMIPEANFILTDLPEAIDILTYNILTTELLGYAAGTTVEHQVLDWNAALDKSYGEALNHVKIESLRPDLVLVSDCTYNSSSFEALIATLVQVAKQARDSGPVEERIDLDVLLSCKTRHESECEFFREMHRAGFEILAREETVLPDRTRTDLGLEHERAQIFAFGFRPAQRRRSQLIQSHKT